MEILTYINFLAGPSESANTADNGALFFIILLSFALIIGTALYWMIRSKKLSSVVKRIIGFSLPSIFILIAIPLLFANQSYAAGSSTSVNAIVDTDNGVAYIENGTIQNTSEDDMQLIVTNSQAANSGLNIPGLNNANLKVTVEGYVVFNGNPFDDYEGNMDLDYELKPGQTAQFSSELTGLDNQTCQALEGSGNSIQMRFKFYYSMVDKNFGPEQEAPVADYLYEAEYKTWDIDKTNFLCECLAKTALLYPADSEEYKDYLRREWGCNEEEVKFIVELRKYLEDYNPYTTLCTSCRYGDYIGRNFDWAYDDLDEYIIRTKKSPEQKHFESIGVASTFFPKALQDLIEIKTVLPMLTMDGVNDQGVAININVVPSDLNHTIGTNPGAKRLCAGVVPRYILDNATSAEHAISLLMERDIFTITLSEFHFMISDTKETYIVEMSQNKLVVLKHTREQETAMSNFHVTNSPYQNNYELVAGEPGTYRTEFTDHPMGIERYDLAIDGLKNVTGLDSGSNSMVDHMEHIYYKHVNLDWNIDGGGKKFWSDKNGQPSVLNKDHIFSYYDEPKWDNDRIETFKHNEENYRKIHDREDEIGWRLKSDEMANFVCQTVHASCYDIAKRELAVNVQERDVTFHFTLNGAFRERGSAYEAKDLYVNGDNVGLATSCSADGSAWNYDKASNTLTLGSDVTYSITGSDASKVSISDSNKVGYSITIPKIEHASAIVTVNGSTTAKARMGIRAVPKNSKITVKFIADSGYVFENGDEDPDTLIQEIDPITGNIIFGTADYPLPVAKKKDIQ